MASSHYKDPPSLFKSSCYDSSLKEIKIWQSFTDLAAAKQRPALFLTLDGKVREAGLELEVSNISDGNGVDKIIGKLNTMLEE